MTKVCIIGVYFGAFPAYFPLWLKSAKANPTVDFLIFTDQKEEDLPLNVKFVELNLSAIQKLASEKLGFEVCLQKPYKCCDFRPAYGLIFRDYLKNYDYWGHCDFDLIWGDLRGLFNRFHLEKYDKFLPLGHLALYKNTEENNKRFMLEGSRLNYKTVFSENRNFAFDETNGICQIYKKNDFPFFDGRIFADISKIYRRFRLALEDKNYDQQVFCWDRGHVYRYYHNGSIQTEEFIYIHFKERGDLPMDRGVQESSAFYVTNTGFFPCDPSQISLDEIQKHNRFDGAKSEKRELQKFEKMEKKAKLKRALNKFLGKEEAIR